MAIVAKATLKGTSSNIQKFWLLQERYNNYLLEIAKQFLLCYNNLITAAKQILKGIPFNI